MRLFAFSLFAIIMSLVFQPISSAITVGPYSSRVLDSQNEKPLHGASFFIYRMKHVQVVPGLGGYSEKVDSMLIYSDENGKYEIPGFSVDLKRNCSLATTVIVYMPGYQAYINNDADKNFRKKSNIIKLDRISPNFDHKAHYKKIVEALGPMVENDGMPPMVCDPFSVEKPMAWDTFIEKSLLEKSWEAEAFLGRAEWENRR